MNSSPLRRSLALVVALAFAVVACGGDDDDDPAAIAPAATVSTTASSSTTSTSVALGAEAPLTGARVPLDSEDLLDRPALAVKVHNGPEASPQAGLTAADLIYEEVVGSNVTRLVVVYHSTDADPIGPIRSARTSDPPIVENLRTPFFAFSGANEGTLRRVRAADLVSLPDTRGVFYREDGRGGAPHDLMSSTQALYEMGSGRTDTVPDPVFVYRAEGESAAGQELDGARIGVTSGFSADVAWDAERGEWLRWQHGAAMAEVNEGTPDDGTVTQVGTANVVVADVPYVRNTVDERSPEASPVGEGPVWVLTDGRLVEGTWRRSSTLDPWDLQDASGAPIRLTPGRTWFVLARSGAVTELAADDVAALPPFSVADDA